MKGINPMLWLLLGVSAMASPVSAQQKVKTSVEKVTLFIDGAQITRTKQIDLPAGNSSVVFTGLSPYLDDKSMQVGAKGKFTVTAVNRLFSYTDSLERSTRQKALEKQLDEIEQQQKKLTAGREVIEAENQLLSVNCSVGNRNAATSLTAIKELNEYYVARLQELKQKTLALDEQSKLLDDKRQQVSSELAQLGNKLSVPTSEIEVKIEAPAACKASFEVTYYVRNARWFPSYDVRSERLSDPIEIAYKANISQNTGENWNNVKLTLSSSNPNTGSIAPQLKTYWLDYGFAAPRYNMNLSGNTVTGTVYDPERDPLIGVTVMVPGTTVGTITDQQGHYTLTIPNGAETLQYSYIGFVPRTLGITGTMMNVTMQEDSQKMEEAVVVAYGLSNKVAGVSTTRSAPQRKAMVMDESASAVMQVEQTQNRLGYEFEIKQPYTVPSDGKVVTAEIARIQLPAAYNYRSTPKIDKDAFLQAEVTDWEQFNLLQGEANVYFENTFVGKSILAPGQNADTLRFSMGRDKGIRIERTKEADYVSRRFIGSNQTQSMAWKITVRNTRPEPVSLTLCDQLPVSRNSAITVTEDELSGGELDKTNGTVTWHLTLQPGEQRDLRLRYSVKYAKGQHLTIE